MRKKNIIAFVFSLFILTPFLFSTGIQIFQLYLKQRAEHRLETEQIITIKIPLLKVQWVEKNREISVDGKMFDLKNFIEKDGWFIAQGVYDEKETRAMEMLKNFNDREQNNFIVHLFLFAQCFIVLINWILSHNNLNIFVRHFSFFLLKKSGFILQKLYPPPRQLLHEGY